MRLVWKKSLLDAAGSSNRNSSRRGVMGTYKVSQYTFLGGGGGGNEWMGKRHLAGQEWTSVIRMLLVLARMLKDSTKNIVLSALKI